MFISITLFVNGIRGLYFRTRVEHSKNTEQKIQHKRQKRYSHQHQAFDPMKSINPVIPVNPRFPVQTVSVSPDVVYSAAFLHSAPQNCPSTAVFPLAPPHTHTTPSPPALQLCRVLLLMSRLSEVNVHDRCVRNLFPAFTFI